MLHIEQHPSAGGMYLLVCGDITGAPGQWPGEQEGGGAVVVRGGFWGSSYLLTAMEVFQDFNICYGLFKWLQDE